MQGKERFSMEPDILIVEDSRTQAAVLKGILQGAGYRPEIAPDGEKAMARLQDWRPRLVISDK